MKQLALIPLFLAIIALTGDAHGSGSGCENNSKHVKLERLKNPPGAVNCEIEGRLYGHCLPNKKATQERKNRNALTSS